MNYLRQLEYLGLEKLQVGGSKEFVTARCPFHDDKVPSFSVSLRDGSWTCWSKCGKGTYVELLGALVGEHKVPTRATVSALEPVKFIQPPITYHKMSRAFSNRGFTFSMTKPFGIGWDEKRESMFIPVHDIKGKMVGGIWRQADGKMPKYVNSPGLDRNHLVYGLHLVPNLVSEVWVCEGPLNAVWLTAAGKKAVALFGAAYSRTQIDTLLTREPQKVILAFDNDKAGKDATRKLIDELTKRKVNLGVLELPEGINDVQEIPINEISNLKVQKATKVILGSN